MAFRRTNWRRDDRAATPGETVDAHNDILLTADGKNLVFRHNDWRVTERDAIPVKIYSHIDGAIADALMVWEREHNPVVSRQTGDEDGLLYGSS